MRKGNIEFRWSECNRLHEIVKWQNTTSCYTIAFFRKHEEGYYMETIGERFFEDHNAWIVAKYGMQFLNACFNDE